MAKHERAGTDRSDTAAAKTGAEAAKAAALERRAQALRDNLKRRKEQERARRAAPKPPG